MSDNDSKVPLPDLEGGAVPPEVVDAGPLAPDESVHRGAADLEAVFDVPVQVSAVLGRTRMEVGDLLKLGPGAVLRQPPAQLVAELRLGGIEGEIHGMYPTGTRNRLRGFRACPT